jgi:hypothetical protein
MSALPPKADIDRRYGIVRFVPKAELPSHSITWVASMRYWLVPQ